MSSSAMKLRWALAASLGLNLFFAGYLVARPSDSRRDFATEMRKPNVTLRRVFRERREVLIPLRKSVREAHRAARAELEREPLDEEALREALTSLRASRNQLAESMHAIVLEVAPQVAPADRKVLLGRTPGARRK